MIQQWPRHRRYQNRWNGRQFGTRAVFPIYQPIAHQQASVTHTSIICRTPHWPHQHQQSTTFLRWCSDLRLSSSKWGNQRSIQDIVHRWLFGSSTFFNFQWQWTRRERARTWTRCQPNHIQSSIHPPNRAYKTSLWRCIRQQRFVHQVHPECGH